MGGPNNPILATMLERLLAGLLTGPNLNCRPHNSRQRIDLVQFDYLQDIEPGRIVRDLLGPQRKAVIRANATPPEIAQKSPRAFGARASAAAPPASAPPSESTEAAANASDVGEAEESGESRAWKMQTALLKKLKVLINEAKTYENDTGVSVLNLGFPLLSLPPGSRGNMGAGGESRRILAPVAFVPVLISMRAGARPEVEIACRFDAQDTVAANPALLAWIERETGQATSEMFEDLEGDDPLREIDAIVKFVAESLGVEPPPPLAETSETPEPLPLKSAPRADEATKAELIMSAVLGLFPMNNQGLLRDTQAMVSEGFEDGPIESFVHSGVSLDAPAEEETDERAPTKKRERIFLDERAIAQCDPCQARAVAAARANRGLVVHGPPGTGKSQTITNIIGDHLSRGERVLMVCDKRTALDVVYNRLEHLGLGDLCALIHDPQRDQRDLYRQVRNQLETLSDTRVRGKAEIKLASMDAELTKIHTELRRIWTLLMQPPEGETLSFHELAGRWLEIPETRIAEIDTAKPCNFPLERFEQEERRLHDLFTRAERVAMHENPWVSAAGVELDQFVRRPMQQAREALSQCVEASRACDEAANPTIPAFSASLDFEAQADARSTLATHLEAAIKQCEPALRQHWARQDATSTTRALKQWSDAKASFELITSEPLDSELAPYIADRPPSLREITEQIATLERYSEIADRWYGFIFFSTRSRASAILQSYGLSANAADAARLLRFLRGVKARLVAGGLNAEWSGAAAPRNVLADEAALQQATRQYGPLFETLAAVDGNPNLQSLAKATRTALVDELAAGNLLEGLQRSPARARALVAFRQKLQASELFSTKWIERVLEQMAEGKSATPVMQRLEEQFTTLEDVLRLREEQRKLPSEIAPLVATLLQTELSAEARLKALRKNVLHSEILSRFEATPELRFLDAHALANSFARYRELEAEKRKLVRDSILDYWRSRQRDRLLASTGSRLNGEGADLKRRFLMRGDRALRLRQAIALGQKAAGGDPLFDLRPVWLASPETVAQIFPRKALFDVVIFDEASQCRLEEALPVLTRAKRVVIAGDPKQLPPTRFFESSLATSEFDSIETEDDLFEAQQSEIEDLLTGALTLSIEHAYLDVHYRSSNADLIAFSNQQFYGSRLQPIPGHPSNRPTHAPLRLYVANGVYKDRANEIEAERVCEIVRELLSRRKPPSIGIACFNLSQRDMIVDKLDELAESDADFAARLAEARTRRGAASFEGLFVKNLENVQGDERDHIIISTTYGPDPSGKFYRRFGPLARAGGGRRLNVLITRARDEIHLVTSIPASEYRALEPVPAGQAPTGSWLLYAYLKFAEEMAKSYEQSEQEHAAAAEAAAAAVKVYPNGQPSRFAQALAYRLAERHDVGAEVHWGNEGFNIEIALKRPHSDDVSIGVLVDGPRFSAAEDPVEWDVFRTSILESTGWKLRRLWSPLAFRDLVGVEQTLAQEAAQAK